MKDLESELRRRFLDQLEGRWDDEDPRMDFGLAALPYFAAAFEKESIASRRARLIRVIWQFRDPAALPTLAVALKDPDEEVWKDALDGIVTIGGAEATAILDNARTIAEKTSDLKRVSWIEEARTQIAEGF